MSLINNNGQNCVGKLEMPGSTEMSDKAYGKTTHRLHGLFPRGEMYPMFVGRNDD
jgi:hypothetical protein